MKGWWGHSVEHSLAARGYLYHGTTSYNLKRIKEEGLKIDSYKVYEESGDYIYLTRNENKSKMWGEEASDRLKVFSEILSQSVILRINKNILNKIGKIEKDPYFERKEFKNNFRFKGIIPPELIEIKGKDGKWRKLKR